MSSAHSSITELDGYLTVMCACQLTQEWEVIVNKAARSNVLIVLTFNTSMQSNFKLLSIPMESICCFHRCYVTL